MTDRVDDLKSFWEEFWVVLERPSLSCWSLSVLLARRSFLWGVWLALAGGTAGMLDAVVARADDMIGGEATEGVDCVAACGPAVWMVDTRAAPKCSRLDDGFECLRFFQWNSAGRRFVMRSREAFLEAQRQRRALWFCHGNSYRRGAAVELLWQLHARLEACSVECVGASKPGRAGARVVEARGAEPQMLVLWSWPAEQVHYRPALLPAVVVQKNLRTKYVYAERQGFYLARLLRLSEEARSVTICGHSYGCVLAAVGLHYLGGGELAGYRLEGEGGTDADRVELRAAWLAPAMDCDVLSPQGRYGRALAASAQTWLTFNPHDCILRVWPQVSQRHRSALGVTGLSATTLGHHSGQVMQILSTGEVGHQHFLDDHLGSARMVRTLSRIAFTAEGIGAELSCL